MVQGTIMRNRLFQKEEIHNNREYVLKSRLRQGDCLWCGPNHNENTHGEHSRWGRKVAKRREYTKGKGRKKINWDKFGPWDLMDKHYEEKE